MNRSDLYFNSIPEYQWESSLKTHPSTISRIGSAVNSVVPIFSTFSFIEWMLPKQLRYKIHLSIANTAYLNNLEKSVQTSDDILHFQKALEFCELTERTEICYQLALCYAMRHLPKEKLVEKFTQGNHVALFSDLRMTKASIANLSEVLESIRIKISKLIKNNHHPDFEKIKKKSEDFFVVISSNFEGELEPLANQVIHELDLLEDIGKEFLIVEKEVSFNTDTFSEIINLAQKAHFLRGTNWERMATLLKAGIDFSLSSEHLPFLNPTTSLFRSYRDYSLAKIAIKKLIALNPHFDQIQLTQKLELCEESIARIQENLNSLVPKTPALEILFRSKNKTTSKNNYKKIDHDLDLSDKATLEQLLSLGDYHLRKENLLSAIEVYQLIVSKSPTIDHLYTLAKLYENTGDFEKAIENFLILCKKEPHHLSYNRQLAELYYLAGNYEQALLVLDRLANIYSCNPKIQVSIADQFSAMNNHKSAIKHYKTAIQLSPTDHKVQQAFHLGCLRAANHALTLSPPDFSQSSDYLALALNKKNGVPFEEEPITEKTKTDSIKKIKEILSDNSQDFESSIQTILTLSEKIIRKGANESIETILEMLLKKEPDLSKARQLLSAAYHLRAKKAYQEGFLKLAITLGEKAIAERLLPAPAAYSDLATWLVEFGKHENQKDSRIYRTALKYVSQAIQQKEEPLLS